jgi:surface antigen
MRTAALLLAAGLVLAGCATGPPPVEPTAGDLERLHAAETEALESAKTGQGVNWTNPETGHRGSVTVLETDPDGDRPCRTVQRVFNAGETTRTAEARACRRDDGSWEIVEEAPLRTAAEQRRAREFGWRFGYGRGVYFGARRFARPFGWPHPYGWGWGPPRRAPY